MYEETVKRTWSLGNRMLTAANRPLHTTVLALDIDQTPECVVSAWAGGEPEESLGAYYGPGKVFELVHTIRPKNPQIVLTPVTDFPYSTKYRGGVLRKYNNHFLITACSAWSQNADLLMALLLNFSMTNEVRFHHVGFRYPTYQEMKVAVERISRHTNTQAVHVPAEDHDRYYFRVEDPQAPNKMYWQEHQWFPERPDSRGVHWDLATDSNMVGFISQHLGIEAEYWDSDPMSPFAMLSLTDSDGTELSVMGRSTWSAPEDW